MTYYDNVNPELLSWVPLSARRVIEFGCGEGALAAAYKLSNPGSAYTAVELNSTAAQTARMRVDRLIEGDVEGMSDSEIACDGLFDVAIMGDVLEHLADPWKMLSRIHALLEDGGHFVLCVPNISHWCGLVELLSGRWPAHTAGLFDRTHLRFFTQDSITTILRESGFEISKIRPRNIPVNQAVADRVIPVLSDAIERLGLDRQAFVARANALQYVLVARKVQPPRPVRIMRLHIAAMAPQFLDVRTRLPAEGMNSLPDVVVTRAEKTLQLPAYPVDVPKICVLQRLAISNEPAYLNWVRDRAREGWLLVAESDDHPALLAAVHGRDPQKESWLTVTGVHAVQTSTPALADVYREHNPEIATFPNAVFNLPPFVERVGPLRIFLGALNRERITRPVAQALAGFCKAHPEAEFVVVHDRTFFDALPTARKAFHPATGYDTYLDLMAGCHIALMPLEGTFGETFKSDVKFLEAASRSVVAIASPTVYADTIVDGETGLIARAMEDWGRLLDRLASDDALRQRLVRAAWDYVKRERMFASQVQKRRDWYNSLWDRRAELNATMLLRHPQLSSF